MFTPSQEAFQTMSRSGRLDLPPELHELQSMLNFNPVTPASPRTPRTQSMPCRSASAKQGRISSPHAATFLRAKAKAHLESPSKADGSAVVSPVSIPAFYGSLPHLNAPLPAAVAGNRLTDPLTVSRPQAQPCADHM